MWRHFLAKLTKRFVEKAGPRSAPYIAFDTQVPRFGIRVMPSGIKSYLVQYRHGGRTRRVTFGKVGTLTPDEARKIARDLLFRVAKGEDPAQSLALSRRAPTVADFCDRFMREHVAHHCKPTTTREYQRAIDIFIRPKLGTLKIGDVIRRDITELHQKHRETPYQANRTLGVLSKVFNLAEEWGFRPDGSNPCRHVKKYRESKRERFLSPTEYLALGNALSECERTESPAAIAAIRLLALTGCRLSEILNLKWEHVHGDTLRLPASKTGPKVVYLGSEAKAALDAIEVVHGNPFVIVGTIAGQHLIDLQKPWRRIRKLAGLPDLRLHDLRHSFASMALNNGEGLPVIGRLLGHSQVQTTARYAHWSADPVRQAATRISRGIANALSNPAGKAANDNSQPDAGVGQTI